MNYRDRIFQSYVSKQERYRVRYASGDAFRDEIRTFDGYYRRYLPSDKQANVLDIGCGSGAFVGWLHSRGFPNATGIDLSAEQIAIGNERGIRNLRVESYAQALTDKAIRYELVYSNDLLEHLHKADVLEFLEYIYDSLATNGKIIIGTPNAESLFSGRVVYRDFTHENGYTPNSLEQILSQVGFKNIRIYPKEPIVHGVKSLVRYGLWKLISFIIGGYLLIETGSGGSGIFTASMYCVAEK